MLCSPKTSKKDTISYNTTMSALSRGRFWQKALVLFEQMPRSSRGIPWVVAVGLGGLLWLWLWVKTDQTASFLGMGSCHPAVWSTLKFFFGVVSRLSLFANFSAMDPAWTSYIFFPFSRWCRITSCPQGRERSRSPPPPPSAATVPLPGLPPY